MCLNICAYCKHFQVSLEHYQFFMVTVLSAGSIVISALHSSCLANSIHCYVTLIVIVVRRCVKTQFLWPDSCVDFYWTCTKVSAIRPLAGHGCQHSLTSVKFFCDSLKLFSCFTYFIAA